MQRFFEIDLLRGIAVIMMIVFHFVFDLDFFKVASLNLDNYFWLVFARATAIIFIFLVGLSLTISYSRKKAQQDGFKKYLKRGLKILSLGFIITLVTFIAFPQWTIWFGILHFIGLSIIIAYPLLVLSKKKYFNFVILFLVLITIIGGFLINRYSYDFPYLLWLGLEPSTFYTFDYFPLLPWFGVVMLGIFVGKLVYKQGKSPLKQKQVFPLKLFTFLGRHSLIIYLLHQPVLSLLIVIGVNI
ncbi:MAG: heparan-alpha-glucosaminide N-acetyltransferase [Candidatus Pacearchaeota archaeon]